MAHQNQLQKAKRTSMVPIRNWRKSEGKMCKTDDIGMQTEKVSAELDNTDIEIYPVLRKKITDEE